MANNEQFGVFCTVDVSSELLTKFLMHTHAPACQGLDIYNMQCAIIRSTDLTSITERTPIPTSTGIFPTALTSPFPNWTPAQILNFLSLHAAHTNVHSSLFIILDARSLQDTTCLLAHDTVQFADTMRVTGHELKTLRSTFRNALISLVNWDIANMDIDEDAENVGPDGVSAIGETEEQRERDRGDSVFAETVLRSGNVLRG